MTNNKINIKGSYGVAGIYSFNISNAITGEVREVSDIIADDHPNMILDIGLEALGTTNIALGCRVGTGSTPVNASQTTLANTLASTTTQQANTAGIQSTPPYFVWGRRTFRFNAGVAAGNLTEVGVYSQLSGNPLFSRALIVDSSGNPTTLTILSDEYLDVTYEIRIYPYLNDQTFTVTLLGVDYTVLVRAANVNSVIGINSSYIFSWALFWYTSYNCYYYNGDIGTITGNPSGSAYSLDTTFGNYVSNSYERTAIASLGLNDGNLAGGIKSVLLRSNKAYWQASFTPAIPKDNFKTLVMNYTIGWSRYTP